MGLHPRGVGRTTQMRAGLARGTGAARQDPLYRLDGSCRFTSGHLAAIVAIHESLPPPAPGAAPLSPPLAWTVAEAAELLRCTASWLKEQARSGSIPYVKLSGSYHFTDADLAEIIRIFGSQPRGHRRRALPAARLPRQLHQAVSQRR